MENLIRKKSPVDIDFDKADEQEQSLFFTMLPLDIRRHVYLQLWLDYGTTQHIHLFGVNSYLTHYPCLLEDDAFNYHRPPNTPPPEHEPESHTQDAADLGVQSALDNYEPEFYDDPGDIDGAIQDITAPLTQDLPAASSESAHSWDDSPWCMHKKCFREFMENFGQSFKEAYKRNYVRAPGSASGVLGITKPLIVCKKMYTEASESLFSKVAFSFPNLGVLELFMNSVPLALRQRIRTVDVLTTTTTTTTDEDAEMLLVNNRGTDPLVTICTDLESLVANVQELRICLHLTFRRWGQQRKPLPNKEWFEPLYHLFDQLKKQGLRKLEIKLVTRCDTQSSDDKDLMTYGSTPKDLTDAPFSVILVPQGWHFDSDCGVYWVGRNSQHV